MSSTAFQDGAKKDERRNVTDRSDTLIAGPKMGMKRLNSSGGSRFSQ